MEIKWSDCVCVCDEECIKSTQYAMTIKKETQANKTATTQKPIKSHWVREKRMKKILHSF